MRAAACLETHRKGIGIEIDAKYCEIARQRILKEEKLIQPRLIQDEQDG